MLIISFVFYVCAFVLCVDLLVCQVLRALEGKLREIWSGAHQQNHRLFTEKTVVMSNET
jgi:hypothetical protein